MHHGIQSSMKVRVNCPPGNQHLIPIQDLTTNLSYRCIRPLSSHTASFQLPNFLSFLLSLFSVVRQSIFTTLRVSVLICIFVNTNIPQKRLDFLLLFLPLSYSHHRHKPIFTFHTMVFTYVGHILS